MTRGLVQLPGRDKEYSVYATEAKHTGPDSRVRRFTFRVDGFVSFRSGEEGGELLTKELTFQGHRLEINYAMQDEGELRVELQDAAGRPLRGFTLADCQVMRGDAIAQAVSWKGGGNLDPLVGKPIRVRFALCNGDLFSFRFAQ